MFIGLGSNISPEENLPQAVVFLSNRLVLESVSSVWETPPVGGGGPNYLNAVALIRTGLSPDNLRAKILRPIETQLGRVRTEDPNAPRTIDLDILLFNEKILDPGIWTEIYLAVPLAELYPTLENDQGVSLQDIASKLTGKYPIRQRGDVWTTRQQIAKVIK